MDPRQLRLLLWKDYLTRKRKLVTLAGVIWATAVMISIYIVRANVDNRNYPTCQFPARALPSAGMLPFLQSFICSVNNDCESLDKFDEIPTYENSKLTQLQRQFSPLLYNETVLEVASTVPDALKLLATLADVVDEPTFVEISKNGLKVRDLFSNPVRVRRYLSSRLGLSQDVASAVMEADLSFQGILNGGLNRCSATSISQTLTIQNEHHLNALVDKLCALSDDDVQKIVMEVIMDVNFNKFIKMLGNMYTKLTGDERLTSLADTVTAVLRMTRLQSFLPAELVGIFQTDSEFSYFDLELVQKFVGLFKPTFGNTESYKSIEEFANTIVVGLQYMNKFLANPNNDDTNVMEIENNSGKVDKDLTKVNEALNNAVAVLQESTTNDNSVDIFKVLSQVTKFIHKWLPDNLKHDVLLYSTLLTKLIEGANKVISINMNIEERAYNVSLRHPDGVKVLLGLSSAIIAKGFDALADAERTQVMTAKIASPGQMFCDLNRLQGFFSISKEDASSLRGQLCTDAWKNFVSDLVRSFGVYEVKDNINAMASILIQETLGKDVTDQLYSIDHDFEVLKNFSQSLTRMTSDNHPVVNWKRIFNISEDSEFMKTVRSKGHLGKQMLIVVHGALAKEVVKQNAILSYKISPGLIDTTTLVTALNNQLDSTSEELVKTVKDMYPVILETVVRTALNEDKTYKSLSTHSQEIMCNGVDYAVSYLELPNDAPKEVLVQTLCNISTAIEEGLKRDSIFGEAIATIRSANHKVFDDVKWTVLIGGLKDVYVKLNRDYPYLFEYDSYGLSEERRAEVGRMVEDAKRLWFGHENLGKSMHIGLKFGFRLLDLMDRELFNITSTGWLKMKYSLYAVTGPLTVVDDFIETVAAIYEGKSYISNLPPSTVSALQRIVPNIPQLLIDVTDIIITNDTELEPIIAVLNADPPWPCSTTSLSELTMPHVVSVEAVQALESIWCMDQNFTEEWRDYLAEKNVTVFDLKNWNTTSYPDHVFLKFSSALDGLIKDGHLLKTIAEDIANSNNASNDVTWSDAWDKIQAIFNREDRDIVLKNFFARLDTALTAINTTSPPGVTSLHSLWSEYLSCATSHHESCRDIARATWKRSIQFAAVMFRNVAQDLLIYFAEVNEPGANVLQILGFTRTTALYQMYEKMADLMGVLLNSYWDHGFMSQIRRSSLSQFWDCEAVLQALVPPPDSSINVAFLRRIQPYVCPSFLYWVSLPRGDNKLLDVIAKPQYYFFTIPAKNLTSEYKDAYSTIVDLNNLLSDIANKSETPITEEDIKMNSLQYRLETLVDTVINYKINETSDSYRKFYEINKKYFASSIYLTRMVSLTNKLAEAIETLTMAGLTIADKDYFNKVEADLKISKKIFKRRPADIVALHFDVITDVIWRNDNNYTLVDAMESMCEDLKNNETSKVIVGDNNRVKLQICAKSYKDIYKAIESNVIDDYQYTRDSLNSMIKVLQNGDTSNVSDVFEFINQRKQLVASFQNSIMHSYELGIPIYLKYLQNNLHHYDVITSFLAGGEWWGELRGLYNGSRANKFFDSVENSFEITESILKGLDGIHLIRLLRDINVNNSDAFCQPNITLSDYLPDVTGALSDLKRDLCLEDKTDLFLELPPLLFASQGYDSIFKLPRDVDYTQLNLDLSRTETNLDLISKGPKEPQRPPWVTEERLKSLRGVAVKLLSKESLTRMSFGLLSNIVDGGTLFLNNSQCTLCSTLTSWLKQLNLQVFKKQEYDNLLCRMQDMSLSEVYRALQNDFHWDMAIRELILTRNYTKYELNKSLQEFLELVKLHLLDDMLGDVTKRADCLVRNVTRNYFGNVTLFITILSHTARLLRSEAPYLHEVEGVTSLPYFVQLEAQVAPNLDVIVPLKKYIRNEAENALEKIVGDVAKEILSGEVNLKVAQQNLTINEYVILRRRDWNDVCNKYNCNEITNIVQNYINRTLVDKDLPSLQSQEYWRFTFVSRILYHIEQLLGHVGRLGGVFSRVDLAGVTQGQLAALVDFLVQILVEDVTNDVIYSIQGLVKELHPLLLNTSLEHDLQALSTGLDVLRQFKNYLLEKQDLKLEVSQLFSHPDLVEVGLSRLGINNTNFWSIAAPRVHAGYIDLKPILSTKQPDSHISNFVCQMDAMSRVILPSNLDVVTADDVYAAIVEQFCGIPDQVAKQAVGVLMGNLNFSTVMERVSSTLLPLLYSAANLTQSEGAAVLEKYPQMAALLPIVRDSVGDLGETIAQEPLVQSLRGSNSFGGLLGSPDFLSNVGHMMCGKPFTTDQPRFYKAIAASKDYSDQPDQEQLDVLPTDFCRNLYKDIIHMDGGKIVWSFVKPLIMGKILYTPINPTVERIIQKANSTFSHMIKLTSLVHSFAKSFSSLDDLSDHREGIAALQRLISSPSFSDLKTMIMGEGEVPNVDVDGLFGEFGDLQGIGSLLKKGSELLQCINLNRFTAVPDEYQLTHQAVKLSRVNEFSAGLVFLNSDKTNNLKNVEYKIRIDIENAPTTARLKNYLWIPGPESSFIEHMRYCRGFIQIQDLVDSAIIQLSRSNATRQKRETRTEDKWNVYTQQEPYPCYRRDFFQTSLYESQALMVAFFFSLLFTVASTVRFIVADKESGNTMLMSVMGVDLTNHTLSWFLSSLAEMMVTVTCITIVLYAGGILPQTDPTLVFALLVVFGISVLSFCYMLSKVFESASVAAVCSAIAYLLTFMPFVLILSLEAVLSSALKVIVCLSMSTSICYAFLNITRAEARGAGAGWGDVWRAEQGDLSIAAATAMAVVDAVIYLVVGWLLDRFFGPKTLQSSITNCTTSDEKAGVSIVNITKIYGEGSRRQKIALDNVSIELHKGQVTTLLGHNGAGKTTLINILTGMTKPTRGHVTVRSDHSAGPRAGVCPQRDVLFDSLTAAEHVALYAQLKSGLPLEMLQDEIDNMLQVLSLGGVAHEPVCRLSGGTRRRLCVALAFVARPHLVSLDEPTAGVDPAARRDIWTMIVKLREDRTILLTTHHLDEAELLSDQIVIMHKGQVHTTGSPIEIKRSLGNGYKLCVTYPASGGWTEDTSIEEKTKELLSVVRDDVSNAALRDVTPLQVELALPFFDANGLNNDFLRLCTSLEAKQQELGFSSYALDCSSLEQVFFNVTNHADAPHHNAIEYDPELPSKSASTSSVRSDYAPLVAADGPLRGAAWTQFLALLHARYVHYLRNRWLLFLLFVLPSLFVATAMGFSMIRPPADNEISLRLTPDLYQDTTDYIVSQPSVYSDIDPSFAQQVLQNLQMNRQRRPWNTIDTPNCTCTATKQVCEESDHPYRPRIMLLPTVTDLNQWLVASHDQYIEKRYGGFSAALKNNKTHLIAWYNNKGHHAMPAYLNRLNTAILRAVSGDTSANIAVYSHPLKISEEQLSKDTVYQHIADAGISALVLIAYCLVSAGAAIYLVGARCSQQKRLQLLCGVTPAMYWGAALAADMMVIVINMLITIIVFEAFGFPVFVARSNLPAICLLILLYGFSCGSLVHVCEKLFTEASLANMVLFCGNSFVGLAGVTILLILDIISDSDETDYARWVLHKIFLVCPQFVLADGMLEIAKNTIQAQVLIRFGMDTYKDPLCTELIMYHYIALALVGVALMLFNLAIEYDCFEAILARFRSESITEKKSGEMEDLEVAAERKRVHVALYEAERPVRLPTIGNINAGFVDTEVKNNSIKRYVSTACDVAQCVDLGKSYPARGGHRVAVRALTLGIPPGQCTALLGQNGAGKSTTFSMLTGEVRPTAGQIYLNAKPVNSRQLCRGLISYCPQSDAIDPLLTVRESLRFYCRLRGIVDQEEVIKRALEVFDLVKYADVRNVTLSGGNKRKLCTAIAFMGRSPLVLLDEPTSGMDPGSRVCVSRGVAVSCAAGRGVLLSTHALDDARRLCARVALMRRGELCALAGLDSCLKRFGGGYVVACRCRGDVRGVWRSVRAHAPHARLRVLHHAAIHFLMPLHTTVDKKEVTTRLSDVFRMMAQLQAVCDIEDYTVNQSSLDQMFLSFTEKGEEAQEPTDLEPLPSITIADVQQNHDDLNSITSL